MTRKMTDKQARALEAIAARILVAVDERDMGVLDDFSKNMPVDQIEAIMSLTRSFAGEEILRSEENEETKTVTMYTKSSLGYQFARVAIEEQGRTVYTKAETWTSEEDFSDEIVW